MKAWLLDKLEGIANLRMGEVPDPVAARGEAVVSILFAGLNPADRYLAMGQYPAKPVMPHILGRDGIGVIDSVVAAESLAPVPAGWTEEQAGGAALVYLTAHQALNQWGELPPRIVLVTGASGGVGVASVQLAAAAGHTVIALSRSESKRDNLKSIGAAFCFDPTDAEWPQHLKQALGTRKVDLAIDNIGGAGFSQVISVLGHQGKLSAVGRLAGPVPEFNTSTLFFRRIKIGGVAVGDYSPAESQGAWKSVVQTLDYAGVRPLVDSVFPFEQLPQAFEKLHDGPMGKVLLRV
jgi:NADPH2:quinone reductase